MLPATESASARLRFATFEVDLRAGDLRKAGRRVRLAGQPLRILELLVRHPGEVVTREELRHALWPADTFVDFEHNLNSAVKRLRAALGDSAETPRFIETLPRRGYRFLVEVVPIQPNRPDSSVGTAAPEPEALASRADGRARSWRAWIGVALAVVVVGAIGWRVLVVRRSSAAAGEIKSLAVLPFENLSSDPEQAYFADGMTDMLITSLAQIESVRVISRTSVMSYRDVGRPISSIARELSVDGIIEGTVFRAGDQVRITAQLIHARTDRHLWAGSYDGRVSDLLTLQRRVALAIARAVKASLSANQERRLAETTPIDPAVQELYLRGLHLLTRRTDADLRRALAYFDQAVDKDPKYALAYAGMAQAWAALASWPGHVTPKDGYPKAKAAAMRALALDPSLPEAQTTLATVHELFDWDLVAAEREYQQTIAASPNYALAHQRYAQLLGRTGRQEAALEAAMRARALDPLSLETNVGLSQHLLGVGRTEEALAQMLRAVELDPNYFDAYIHLADIYQRLGRKTEAIAAAERGLQLSQRSAHGLHGLAVIYVRYGDLEHARPLMAELEHHPNPNPYDLATLYLQVGETQKALAWLERACDERTPAMIFLNRAQSGPPFAAVRDTERFRKILDCVDRTARRVNATDELSEPLLVPLPADEGDRHPSPSSSPAGRSHDDLQPQIR